MLPSFEVRMHFPIWWRAGKMKNKNEMELLGNRDQRVV